MPIHKVKQGECITSLAARFGLLAEELYGHPANAKLRKSRPNANTLLPGDEVFVPDPGRKEEICGTGRSHRFVIKSEPAEVRIVLQDHLGNVFAGRRFVVQAEELRVEGKTDANGLLVARVPAHLETATLSAWLYGGGDPEVPDMRYELHIGHLDPHDTITGVQARLQNLGYGCPVSGSIDDSTLAAINHFRREHKLPAAAEDADPINDALCSLLAGRHDGGAQ